ncbi:hypothetical protein V3C99_012873 [Haemonchus contortus]
MYWILLLFSIVTSQGAVLKNVSLPQIEHASYIGSTEDLLQIDCANEWEMSLPGFATMEKIWKKDNELNFDTAHIIFAENNQSIRFTSLLPIYSGNYVCCVRNIGEKEYYCTDRNLTVFDLLDNLTQVLDTSANISEEPVNQTALVIRLGPNDQLYAHTAQTYLLKLFNGSVSSIWCNFNGNKTSMETNFNLDNSSFSDDYDVIIRSFDATLHSGNYTCNGMFINGNETEIEEMHFSVAESLTPSSSRELAGSSADEISRRFLYFSFVVIMIIIDNYNVM